MQSTAASSDSAGAKASSAVPRPGGDSTDAALRSGLRAIPATRLATYWHARGGEVPPVVRRSESTAPTTRLRYVTWCALTVGDWSVVAFDDTMCARVAMILANADGDVVLERVARFVRDGVVFDA